LRKSPKGVYIFLSVMCAAGGGELVPIRQGSQPITGPAGSVVHESVINILNRQRAPIWKAWGVKKAAAAMVNNRGAAVFFLLLMWFT
jgi:hypothetical protein